MGVVDRIRQIFLKNKEPDTEVYKQFKKCMEFNLEDIQRFKKNIEQYSYKLEEYKMHGISFDDPLYKSTYHELKRFQYYLYESTKKSSFIRENKEEDIKYRNNQADSFPDKLKKVLPKELDLRFHGTPIYFAEEILKSGNISSSADRFDGYIKSSDEKGEFSVSDINSLSRTVDYFLDISAYQRCIPCGCLFVLTSDGQSEEQKRRFTMDNVDFKREPDRLFGIVTSPENIEKVAEWLNQYGYSTDLVYTFDDFVEEMEKVQRKELKVENKIPLDQKIEKAVENCSLNYSKGKMQEMLR